MILCAGEALIDLIPDATGTPQPHVGGAVLNTARALGRLGEQVALLTGLSSDAHGRLIAAALEESHVSTALAVPSDRPTTLAVVRFENGQPAYEFRDAGSALRELTEADLPAPPPEAQALFFGGISLCNAPVADALAAYAARHAPDHLTLIDPNLRPGFADDVPAYVARLHGMLAVADMVKVSDEDLALLYPDLTPEAGVDALLQAGPRVVFLTLGPDGARAIHANGCDVTVPGRAVSVADTVGAGDTFNAGVLTAAARAGLLDKAGVETWGAEDLRALLTLGVAASAVTVSRAGANPPWANELHGELS